MLAKFLILCSIVGCALSAAIPDGMNPQSQPNGRIVGGEEVKISSVPWVVSIERQGFSSCSGAVYTSNVIITAAHCLLGIDKSALLVRAGSSFRNKDGYERRVSAITVHEQYDPVTMAYDIALLRVQSGFSSNTVQSIPVPYYSLQSGSSATVAGWGSTMSGYPGQPDHLRSVIVKTISQIQCASNSYGYGDKVLPSMICASAPGKDACTGDSGSPLEVGGYLAGIVSWGYGCAVPSYPGVYADVFYVRNWITNAAYYI